MIPTVCAWSGRSFSVTQHKESGAKRLQLGLQFRVLCFGAFQDRDIGICFPPDGQKSLISSLRLDFVSRQHEHSPELQVRQCADWIRAHKATMIEDLLKLGSGFRVPARSHESLAPHIRRVQTAKNEIRKVEAIHRELIRTRDFQPLYAVRELAFSLRG